MTFPNGTAYQLRFLFQFAGNPCWIMDISDVDGTPILCGVPLVTGSDLLAQYPHLNFGCSMWCSTDGAPTDVPTYWNLGNTSHLWIMG